MRKRTLATLILMSTAAIAAQAQQLTRFAVVDLPKLYTVFYQDSKVVRDWEERSRRVQADLDRMTTEIDSLSKARLDAETAGENEKVLRLEADIAKKTKYLQEYYRVKTSELEDQKKRMTQSSAFLQQVYDEIRLVAESEGYSMVLNLKESAGIVWFSPTVDITDLVIQNLMTKAGR
jgi:outer membrane protein